MYNTNQKPRSESLLLGYTNIKHTYQNYVTLTYIRNIVCVYSDHYTMSLN